MDVTLNQVSLTPQEENTSITTSNPRISDVVDQNASKVSENETPKSIDKEALEILGKHLAINKPVGPPVCDELVSRWSEILKVGLPKEDKAALLLKYGPPINCSILNPPKLNPEIKASLTDPIINRDTRIFAKQEKVTACIAAMGTVLSKLLCGETVERLSLIEVLVDTEKLLIDVQREESLTRKALVLSNVNVSIKDTLNSTSIDEWLFGNQLDEKLKTAKTLEHSSKQIKVANKGSTSHASKNFKSPFQHQQKFKQRISSWSGQKKSYPSKKQNYYRKPDWKNEKFSHQKQQ